MGKPPDVVKEKPRSVPVCTQLFLMRVVVHITKFIVLCLLVLIGWREMMRIYVAADEVLARCGNVRQSSVCRARDARLVQVHGDVAQLGLLEVGNRARIPGPDGVVPAVAELRIAPAPNAPTEAGVRQQPEIAAGLVVILHSGQHAVNEVDVMAHVPCEVDGHAFVDGHGQWLD
jgi:hypothetical protein